MKEAMRDKDGNPVFVKSNGEYSYEFPPENIVNRDIEREGFTVYFFVSREDSYVELSHYTKNRQEALDFATDIYGEEIEIIDDICGEVFEVEVHNN